MVFKFKPLDLKFHFDDRWYNLEDEMKIHIDLIPKGEVNIRKVHVDLICEEIHTRTQSGITMGSGGASSIAGGNFARSNDYIPATTSVNQNNESYVHSTVVFLENKTLNSDKPTPHTATLKINPDLPHHFEDAKALVRNAEESWTFKWRIVVSADVIRGRDQKRQKQVKIKLI
jgi:hypothetical protein|tara:strand:- start:44 stop:562 length:519 start_codon:yes stop_codon:yes gene_type:complete